MIVADPSGSTEISFSDHAGETIVLEVKCVNFGISKPIKILTLYGGIGDKSKRNGLFVPQPRCASTFCVSSLSIEAMLEF